MLTLYDHQIKAIEKLKSGSILIGGVGSGKSLTSLAYYFEKILGGKIQTQSTRFKKPINKKDLYIITTARKRDTQEWEHDAIYIPFLEIKMIDSWNNIQKYKDVKDAFFIFDEQRLIGSGAWVDAFLKIAKSNQWVLLSATPGDKWLDYIPVFIANGFYKNRTEFKRRHVVYAQYSKFEKVERYLEVSRLMRLKDSISVRMDFQRSTTRHDVSILCDYDMVLQKRIYKDKWDIYKQEPLKTAASLFFALRKLVNTDPSRIEELSKIIKEKKKVIVFYNFNYELDILRLFAKQNKIPFSEWNGQNHELIPKTKTWLYFVQYTAGAEGWNAIQTDTIVFYSLNYSYRTMEQASGRIDRLNTPFKDLYYYHFMSSSIIDKAISIALSEKRSFNEKSYMQSLARKT